MKKVLSSLFAAAVLFSSIAFGDYASPTLPDWSSNSGYTSQFWGLHALATPRPISAEDNNSTTEPVQPLAPDNYSNNPFGTASATWVTGSAVGWNGTVPGSQPSWVEGIYGGNVIFDSSGKGPFSITASVPTGSATGQVDILVQYDWYDRTSTTYPDIPSVIIPSVAGATEVSSSDEVLAHYATLVKKDWVRTTKLFELPSNSGNITVSLGVSGYSPIIDSFSITTRVVPEPATITVLTIGALGMLLKRRSK